MLSVQAVYSAVLPPIGEGSVFFSLPVILFILVKILAVFFSLKIFIVVLSNLILSKNEKNIFFVILFDLSSVFFVCRWT